MSQKQAPYQTRKNGKHSVPPLEKITKAEVVSAASAMVAMNALQSRLAFAQKAGMQFEGKRDLYKVFGWEQEPVFETYKALYDRNGIAQRIVNIVADETWRKDPLIVDGEIKSDQPEEQLTPFLSEYNKLAARLGVYHHMRNADINCGIGRWSLIFMGMAGDQDLQKPISKPKGNGAPLPQRLLYMTTFDEGQAPKFKDIDREMSSSRFGLPVTYQVFPNGSQDLVSEKLVHFSRVIHIAENTRRSRVIGMPRLQAVLNILYDLEKISGSAAEAFWMGVYQGFVFGVKDDYEIPTSGDADFSDLEEQIENFTHKLSRYIFAEGLDKVQPVKADIVTPEAHFKMKISEASGATGIPQRILIGSERGELASNQDDKNFADATDVRRTKFAEVQFMRPYVDFLLNNNLISQPVSGKYQIEWPSLFELNEVEKADVAYKVAQSIYVLTRNNPTAAAAFPVSEFLKRYLGITIAEPPVAKLDKTSDDTKDQGDSDGDDQPV